WLIWRFVSANADLVSAPPGGHWAYGGTDHPYVAARHWITGRTGRPTEAEALEHLVRRYIAGFGPATIADIAQFTGQVPARIRPALAALTPAVRRFRDLDGRTYFDLPRAPRPAPDRAVPVRFLPRYDEVLVAYAQRDRIIDPRYRRAVYSKNGIIEATVLVDGSVAGTWALARDGTAAVVEVTPFAKLGRADRSAVTAEGERLAVFLAPDAASHGTRT